MEHIARSRLKKTYIILLGAAAVCIIAGASIPEQPIPSHILHLIFMHIGIGLVVACLVASIFDRLYHEEVIGKPLREIQEKLESAQKGLETFQKELLDLEQTVVKHNTVLRMSKEEGIVAMYYRNSPEFKNVAIKAVNDAKKYIYTIGRSHRTMLIEDGEYPGWLLGILLDRTAVAELTIKVLLANTFEKDSGFRKQLSLLPTEGRARYLASRDTALGLLSFVDERSNAHNLSIKMMRDTPPYALLMTEDRLFVEHYLPSQRGGAYLVFEIENPKRLNNHREKQPARSLYDKFHSDFSVLYNQAEPLAVVLRNYLERKEKEAGGDTNPYLKVIKQKYIPIANKWGDRPVIKEAKPDQEQLDKPEKADR